MRFLVLIASAILVALTAPAFAQRVDINKPGQLFSIVVYGYDRSLGTEKVTDGKLPAQYGKELWDKAKLANTGVNFYTGACATLRLVHVVGVQGTAQVLQGDNMPVGSINMAVGSTFQMCGGSVAKTVLVLPRTAWTGRDPVICYEMVDADKSLPALPKKVEGPFAARHNVDCTIEGQIKEFLNTKDAAGYFTNMRMHLVIARSARTT